MKTHKEIGSILIHEIKKIITEDIQIINGFDLFKIPESQLKFPRLIVNFSNYNDSEYDYTNHQYNANTDKVDVKINKVPRRLYTFRIYNDINKNKIDILKILTQIHQYFSNPYQTYEVHMQVIHTGSILDIKSPLDNSYIEAYQFDLEFDMDEQIVMTSDYADNFEFEFENK